jgi:hypothetical protein
MVDQEGTFTSWRKSEACLCVGGKEETTQKEGGWLEKVSRIAQTRLGLIVQGGWLTLLGALKALQKSRSSTGRW